MSMLDVFKSDIYGVVSLTTAINKLPYVPSRLGEMGLFRTEGVETTTIVVEEERGKLMIVPTAARGTTPNVMGGKTRKAKSFIVPYIPLIASVSADDVQNMRAFGQESQVETVANKVNGKLADMRQAMELTHEWHRIGAVKGIVYDADGVTELYDWFDEFDILQETVGFDFSDDNSVKLVAHEVTRIIQDALGMTPYKQIRAMCGSDFFDSLTTSDEVKAAYNRFKESSFWRENQARAEFEYAGVIWEEYRGAVGATKFFADDEVRFFPTGVQDLFITSFAPPPWIETVNTTGKPIYAKQEVQKWDTGIDLLTVSCPLTMCTRPKVLVLGTDDTPSS